MVQPDSPNCLNCGQPADGAFCPSCGQSTRSPRRAVGAVLGELLDTYFFTLDSKLTRTLRTLLFTPGRLTSQYLAGKRFSQLPPLRLHVVLLVVVFLSLNLVGRYDARYVDLEVGGIPMGEAKMDGRSVVRLMDFEEGSLPRRLFGAQIDAQSKRLQAISDPQVIFDMAVKAIETALPNVLLLSVPITAWVLWLLYRNRKRHYFDHLIFTLHLQSSLLLLLLAVGAIQTLFQWGGGDAGVDHSKSMDVVLPLTAAILIGAMKTVYREGWVLTLVKSAALVAYYWWVVFYFSGQIAAAVGLIRM